MQNSWAVLDGTLMPLEQASVPVSDSGFSVGWTVFETMAFEDGVCGAWDLHLDRLQQSGKLACIHVPNREDLRAEARLVVAKLGGNARLRITLSGSGTRVITATPPIPGRLHSEVRAVRGPHYNDPYLPGFVKHGSRAGWMAAVKRAGVDDVLFVDDEGRFTEGTTCGVLAVINGTLFTAAHDERILPSTTITRLLHRAEGHGIPVVRRGPIAAGPFDGLYVASATRDIAPVVELDGELLPGWDPVGRALADARGGPFDH